VANQLEKITPERARIGRDLDRTQPPELVTDKHGRTLIVDGEPVLRPRPATGDHRADLQARAAQLCDDRGSWQAIREEQIANGVATNYGPDDIGKGDRVKYRGQWYEFVRVNPKTVTVTWFVRTHKPPYPGIQDLITSARWAELEEQARSRTNSQLQHQERRTE
jgi:hypothetical protein